MDERKQLTFIDHLQRANQDQLGFLTRNSLSEYIARQQVRIAFHNDTPCGYLLWYEGRNHHRNIATPNTLRIHQACIDYDVRLLEHGRELVTNLVSSAQHLGYLKVACWVGANIPAVNFWKALGFIQDGTRTNRGRRHPTHLHFTYYIPPLTRDFSQPFQ